MIWLLERARDLGADVIMTRVEYPEVRGVVVRLSVSVPDGSLLWSSPVGPDVAEHVVSMAKMLGVRVYRC